MASCLLCAAPVGSHDVVCPHCGGAVDDTEDPSAVPHEPPPPSWDGGWVAPAPGPTPVPEGWGASPPGLAGPAGSYGSGPGGPAAGPYQPGPYGPPYGSSPYGSPAYGEPASAGPPYAGPPYAGNPGTPYGSAPYPGVPYIPVYVPAPLKVPTEGLAIASLVTSLVGLVLAGSCFFPILACPVGAVMGHMALRRIDDNGHQGRGMAKAGIIIGWIGTALMVLGFAFFAVAISLDGGFS